MPFEAVVDAGIVRLTGKGDADMISCAAAVADLRRLPGFAPGMPIFADLRALDYLPSAAEVDILAREDGVPAALRGHPTALLARAGAQYGVARRFATLACIAGAAVEVFGDPESADSWIRGFAPEAGAGLRNSAA